MKADYNLLRNSRTLRLTAAECMRNLLNPLQWSEKKNSSCHFHLIFSISICNNRQGILLLIILMSASNHCELRMAICERRSARSARSAIRELWHTGIREMTNIKPNKLKIFLTQIYACVRDRTIVGQMHVNFVQHLGRTWDIFSPPLQLPLQAPSKIA